MIRLNQSLFMNNNFIVSFLFAGKWRTHSLYLYYQQLLISSSSSQNNKLNLIMDEICLKKPHPQSLYQCQQLFLQLCNHQRIFLILYDFIGFSGFVQLSATNSQVYKAINKHQQLQVVLLKLKVKILKQRQVKRRFPFFWRIDLALYNPYLLPYYSGKQIEEEKNEEEIDQQEKAIIEAKKFKQNDFIRKKNWEKWKNNRRLQNKLTKQTKHQQVTEKRENYSQSDIVNKFQNILQPPKKQKIFYNSIDQDQIFQEPIKIKKKELVEEQDHLMPYLKSRYSDPELDEQKRKNYVQIKIKAVPPPPRQPSDLLQVKDQFYLAWDENIKKRTLERLWPQIYKNQKSSWLPLQVPRRVKRYVQSTNIYNSIKTKVSQIFKPKTQPKAKSYLTIKIQ